MSRSGLVSSELLNRSALAMLVHDGNVQVLKVLSRVAGAS